MTAPVEPWYVDKSSGRRRQFTPASEEAVVRLAGTGVDALTDLVATPPVRSVSRGANLARRIAAVHVLPGIRPADLAALSGVEAAIAVMTDDDGLRRYFVPDELTVRFRGDVPAARAEELIARLGSRILVRQRTRGYFTIALPVGIDLFAAVRAFAELREVAFAEPSEIGFDDALAYVPDDPDFPRLWGMRNTGQVVNGVAGTAGADIAVTDAWDLHRGDPRVIIAVIDTGADLDHPDLAANLLPRGAEDWDFSDAADPVPDDGAGHGTHVAGTAAGVDNTVGVVGVAPGCRIMPLRINLQAGMNQNRADAISYVADQATANPDLRYVVNCSWRTSGDHAGVRTAIGDAVAADVVVVFAAGNANRNTDVTPEYPGVYPTVIAVAALDQDDRRAVFSNFGTNVDVSAPGVNIWSSLPDDTHGFLDGTSMAAPHVAGLAALVRSAGTCLSGAQVRRILEDTCDDVDGLNPGFAGQLGRGRVNAFAAVQLAQFLAGHVTSMPAFG